MGPSIGVDGKVVRPTRGVLRLSGFNGAVDWCRGKGSCRGWTSSTGGSFNGAVDWCRRKVHVDTSPAGEVSCFNGAVDWCRRKGVVPAPEHARVQASMGPSI